jgi:bifunctional UDP-N-acetylglucosamine pyrophosphorylase/glucosamine-1-phosphate N-acetyltransferase
MKSGLPKVMHALCGAPLLAYPIRAALDAGCDEVIVVVGYGRDVVAGWVDKTFGAGRVKLAIQAEPRGTGDAARAGLSAVDPASTHLLVFYGDVPLIEARDVAPVLAAAVGSSALLALATCSAGNPFGYGRIVRDGEGRVTAIREQKDLKTPDEHALREMNPGIFAMPVAFARDALSRLQPNNAQREYYLTDLVAMAAEAGNHAVTVEARAEVMDGVNDRRQLAEAEDRMYKAIADRHRLAGVTVRGDARIEPTVTIATDAVIESGCVLRGATSIGAGATLDIGCVLTDVKVAAGANLKPYSVATSSTIGERAQIGPFTHLRPESVIGEDAHVGNFVELKKTSLGKGSKANHLAYLGDGIVGEGVNIGAGTIFCNYDGVQKHVTTLEDGAFIGSDSQLVAPVTIGKGAYVGTGTTVTRNVPAGALAISRVRQENKDGYATKLNAKFKAAKEAAKTGK